MKKFMIALAATTTLAVAAPVAAQGPGQNIQLRVSQLQSELQAGVQNGSISRSEAMPLREQLRQLSQLERRYAVGGINGRERADLQHRINNLRQGIRMAARNGNGRYDRDDNRYDRDGDRYDRRYERNDRRYDRDDDDDDRDDRRYDRNGNWDDRNRDGRYDDNRYDRDDVRDGNNRGLIGQVIDRFSGRGGLQVGQRATNNLGALPYAYRNQFRDGNGAYYRTDGRQIYQIDARNHVIVRIFTMNR